MSCTDDAYMLAIERAFPILDQEGQEAVFDAMMEERLTDEQQAAIDDELSEMTREYIGRPPRQIKV